MEKPEYQNMKVWLPTLANLRLIHAFTGEQMVKIVDRLVKQELERIQKEQQEKKKDSEVDPQRRPGPFSHEPSLCYSTVISE